MVLGVRFFLGYQLMFDMDENYVGLFTYFDNYITDHLWIHQRNILVVVCIAAIILLSMLGTVVYYIVKHYKAIARN